MLIGVIKTKKINIMEKKLFEIDGYRIWAYTYDEAYQNYLQILRF